MTMHRIVSLAGSESPAFPRHGPGTFWYTLKLNIGAPVKEINPK
jgi:hypothetical protein